MAAVPLPAVPQSSEGFYAINNEFQMLGPKGFQEYKVLENDVMYVRTDFPGVPDDGVTVSRDESKQFVYLSADAPKVHKHDSSHRKYFTMIGLGCGCCEISSFTYQMTDGVLRLHISKTNLDDPPRPTCTSFLAGLQYVRNGPYRQHYNRDPYHPCLSGPEVMPHPNVSEGSTMACESKQLQNGGLYVRLDMPGVPKDRFNVTVSSGRVKVTGQAPSVSDDSGGRFYSGYVAMLSAPVDVPSRRIKTINKNGVIRLIIPSV